MTDLTSKPTPSARAGARHAARRTTTARALLAALAMGATLSGWALIAHDSQDSAASADTTPATLAGSDTLLLTPLPTVVPPLADLDQITSGQAASDSDSRLLAAPSFTLQRRTLPAPFARSRSSS